MKLTIHTATFNRAYILENAYNSLCNQTNKSFEWIITDDGSNDGTEELVRSWIKKDNGFSIIYNKLEHVGIPRALNSGISITKTDWFMMLDSDDYILPNAVENILNWIDEIKGIENIGGIGFAKSFPNGNYMKNQIPNIDEKIGYVDATHVERYKYNLNMDMCEVHKTELLRQYPFQYWPSEMYAPEQLNYYEMALAGWKLRWRKDKLYICEYLPDGQTKDDKLVKRNPMGFAMMHNQNMLIQEGLKNKFKSAVYMIALVLYSNEWSYLKKSNNKLITTLALPLGILVGIRRKMQFSKLD